MGQRGWPQRRAALLPHFIHETLNLGQGTCLAGGHTAWEEPEPSVSDPKARHGDRMTVAGSCTTLTVSPQAGPSGDTTWHHTDRRCRLQTGRAERAVRLPTPWRGQSGPQTRCCLGSARPVRASPPAAPPGASQLCRPCALLHPDISRVTRLLVIFSLISCTQQMIAERLLCAGPWDAAAPEAGPALPHRHPIVSSERGRR